MNDKGHNGIVNDKKGSQYCEPQTALLISKTAFLLNSVEDTAAQS